MLSAKKEGKDIFEKQKILKEASRKHIEELEKLKNNIPDKFEWTPEKDSPTNLNLWTTIDTSIAIRSKTL